MNTGTSQPYPASLAARSSIDLPKYSVSGAAAASSRAPTANSTPASGTSRPKPGPEARDDDRGRLRRQVIDPGVVNPVVTPAVALHPALPQGADHLDGLLQHLQPLAGSQRSPSMCSLSASPLPRPRQKRPSSITAEVAAACAITAG